MERGVAVIDLFAGAGGLSVAAAAAGGDVRLHVEVDRVACETLRLNADSHRGTVLEADVQGLHGRELREEARAAEVALVVVGGPPCQPFSKAAFWSEDGDDAAYRRARMQGEPKVPKPRAHGHRNDDRRFLIDDFLRIVTQAKAEGFVMENVASLLAPRSRPMLDALIRRARRAGYRTTLCRANATQFGVAQKRERIFLLGVLGAAAPSPPTPTHSDQDDGLAPVVTAGAVLAPYAGDEWFEEGEEISGRWADHLRTVPPGWNYKAHTAWAGHPNPTFVAETRFWNFLLKLSPDLPSWTIPANPGPWVGPFHWDNRRLRTPELAAIQGFPAGYAFAGTRRERVRQIGNAAPPPLAVPMIATVLDAVVSRELAKEELAWTA